MTSRDRKKLYETLRRRVDAVLSGMAREAKPFWMRRAVLHVVKGGGKRVRPVLLLLACRALNGNLSRALHAAVAVELLHSFTLVHDDIMDHAPTRRGRPAVHTRWGIDRGVLAGDVILGLAYEALLRSVPRGRRTLAPSLTRALLDVCEGQAIDLDFQERRRVTLREYFVMIEKKTAALIGLSTGLGGIIAGGSDASVRSLQTFGRHLGRAFQVRDDLLDVVAEERSFGKIVGGDILERKKTFLVLQAMKKASGKDLALLRDVFGPGRRARGSVARVAGIYRRLGVLEDAHRRIRRETHRAKEAIRSFPGNDGTTMLRWMADELEERAF